MKILAEVKDDRGKTLHTHREDIGDIPREELDRLVNYLDLQGVFDYEGFYSVEIYEDAGYIDLLGSIYYFLDEYIFIPAYSNRIYEYETKTFNNQVLNPPFNTTYPGGGTSIIGTSTTEIGELSGIEQGYTVYSGLFSNGTFYYDGSIYPTSGEPDNPGES